MEPPQERAGVWPADGGAQWQVGCRESHALRPPWEPRGGYPDARRAGLLRFPTESLGTGGGWLGETET